MKLADTQVLGTCALKKRGGSSPLLGTYSQIMNKESSISPDFETTIYQTLQLGEDHESGIQTAYLLLLNDNIEMRNYLANQYISHIHRQVHAQGHHPSFEELAYLEKDESADDEILDKLARSEISRRFSNLFSV